MRGGPAPHTQAGGGAGCGTTIIAVIALIVATGAGNQARNKASEVRSKLNSTQSDVRRLESKVRDLEKRITDA
ncbi:MAG: hypothetical protein ACI89X_000602 [Planctomycetota bacterium]|jgi:uncharacterized protein YlxW (UPF0749 family)